MLGYVVTAFPVQVKPVLWDLDETTLLTLGETTPIVGEGLNDVGAICGRSGWSLWLLDAGGLTPLTTGNYCRVLSDCSLSVMSRKTRAEVSISRWPRCLSSMVSAWSGAAVSIGLIR